ncbi:MAG: acyl carrier protein [Clostridiales bacterium]|nr:acyl carrier protein [Clostridiales bacterium]
MVFEKVREILVAQFGTGEDTIDENTDIVDDLGADSLDLVELMMSLEEEFGVLITDEMVKEIKTVGELANLLEENME